MAPRPYWKGYLKLSLVACPVAVFTATTSSERVSFRQINKQTGNRLRQQLVDDVTREPVDAADKIRGYEVDKNVYVQVEDEEIEALQVESNHTIDIDSFVPRSQIDERYHDSSYYIAPNDQVGREAFAVIPQPDGTTQFLGQSRRAHQWREPRVEAGARLLHRKQFEIAPERFRPRLNQLSRHHLANGVVVERDLERTHTFTAHVGSLERILGPALVTGQPDDVTHISLIKCSMPNAQHPCGRRLMDIQRSNRRVHTGARIQRRQHLLDASHVSLHE